LPWPPHVQPRNTREVIESFLEEAVRLSDLISDLLFLARAESPLGHLRREQVDVGEPLRGMMEYYEASAADGGVSLTRRISDEPVTAELGRTPVQRAVGNLVSNALANTPPGGAVVLSTCTDSCTIRIEVSDTGVGIPAEALPRVFDRFFRVDSARSPSSGRYRHGVVGRSKHCGAARRQRGDLEPVGTGNAGHPAHAGLRCQMTRVQFPTMLWSFPHFLRQTVKNQNSANGMGHGFVSAPVHTRIQTGAAAASDRASLWARIEK
jgi:Histidine kinase-, DNA gyrase B-, and HSP90-like ATPase